MSRDTYSGIREAMRNMPRKKSTTAEVEADVMYAISQGVPQKVIAQDLGIAQSTVSRIKKKYELAEKHEKEREQRMTEKILAGDKENGRLISTAADVYEGTCRRSNGKMAKKVFRATGLKTAQAQWEKWCSDIRGEDAKVAAVEKVHEELIATPEYKDVSHRLPIRKGMQPADVAAMLGAEVNAEKVSMDLTAWGCLLAYIEDLVLPGSETDAANKDDDGLYDISDFVEQVCDSDIPLYALSELHSKSDVRVSMGVWNRLTERALDLAEERADGLPNEMYVTWMADKGPHALFSDMETATRTVDTLNSALEFAGIDKRYEVMDVKPWKG